MAPVVIDRELPALHSLPSPKHCCTSTDVPQRIYQTKARAAHPTWAKQRFGQQLRQMQEAAPSFALNKAQGIARYKSRHSAAVREGHGHRWSASRGGMGPLRACSSGKPVAYRR
eukprot:3268280-Amphidinium_carterae.1